MEHLTPCSRLIRKFGGENTANRSRKLFPSEDLLANMVKPNHFIFPSLKDIGFEHVEMPGFDTSINEETILRYHETRNLLALPAPVT
jgi:hypothetical protein